MTGQAYLDEVIERLRRYLSYVWTCAYHTPGASTQIWGRRVVSNWKPVVVFIHGDNSLETFKDYFTTEAKDKRFHRWGQPVEIMRELIEQFTVPGMLVCDPFCGASSTGVAALATGRLYLGIDCDHAAIQQPGRCLQESSDAA